jgi:hypothetical protein
MAPENPLGVIFTCLLLGLGFLLTGLAGRDRGFRMLGRGALVIGVICLFGLAFHAR